MLPGSHVSPGHTPSQGTGQGPASRLPCHTGQGQHILSHGAPLPPQSQSCAWALPKSPTQEAEARGSLPGPHNKTLCGKPAKEPKCA